MVIQPLNDKEFDIYPETKIYNEKGIVTDKASIKVGQQVGAKGRTLEKTSLESQTIADEVRISKSI